MPMLITQYFSADHDRLDVIYAGFKKAYGQKDFVQARSYFDLFKHGLLRHIGWEEKVLFPIFERQSGMTGFGPTEVMRQEHIIVCKHLETIDLNLDNKDKCLESCAGLEQLLEDHNHKEESMLYPACDNITDLDSLAEIFSKLAEYEVAHKQVA